MADVPASHFQLVARFIRKGTLVPFLGAGVNLSDRAADAVFAMGQLLPSGRELADLLAREFYYPSEDTLDLLRVSQYVAVMAGEGSLYEQLHEIFDHDYAPTALHRFLAEVPSLLRQQGQERYQVILTTNYDDVLERAFQDAGEPYDVVYYLSEGEHRGKCRHVAPDGTATVIDRPNEYNAVSPEKRTVIVKLHGAIDRRDTGEDSFVISEDDYIDFLATGSEIADLLPVEVAAKLNGKTHFLFLGYGLRDWNLRVILRRIWGRQVLKEVSWAVLDRIDDVDRKWWQRWGPMEILEVPLGAYVPRLREVLVQSLAVEAGR